MLTSNELARDIKRDPWQISHDHCKLLPTNPSAFFHLLYAYISNSLSLPLSARACVCVCAFYIKEQPLLRASWTLALRWTKSSGINSARLKENPLYCWVHQFWSTKEGRKCWNEERAGFSLYITPCSGTMQWSEPLTAIIYIEISFSAC